MLDTPHRWTISLSLMCRTEFGEQYRKSIGVAPRGNHRADVFKATYKYLRLTANPNHLVAAGWIDPNPHNVRRSPSRQSFLRHRRPTSKHIRMRLFTGTP